MMNTALILAGGTGTRLGARIPKQYMEVNGRMIISYCLDIFLRHPRIDAVQIVAHPDWRKKILEAVEEPAQAGALRAASVREPAGEAACAAAGKFRGFSAPGTNRQLSIYNGLCDIMTYASENDCVIIHDAARPCVSGQLISFCLDACTENDGAVPVLPMKDTVYLGDGGKILSLLDRGSVYAGQAPEAFRLGKYYAANRSLLPDKILSINGSTEPAVLAGMDIAMISGEESNFKITTQADLERFQAMHDGGGDRRAAQDRRG